MRISLLQSSQPFVLHISLLQSSLLSLSKPIVYTLKFAVISIIFAILNFRIEFRHEIQEEFVFTDLKFILLTQFRSFICVSVL